MKSFKKFQASALNKVQQQQLKGGKGNTGQTTCPTGTMCPGNGN